MPRTSNRDELRFMAKDSNQPASLLIKGGHLLDPAAGVDRPMEVLIRRGRVAEIAPPNRIRSAAFALT